MTPLYKHLQGFEVCVAVYQIYPFETDPETPVSPAQVVTVSTGKQALLTLLVFDHLEARGDYQLARIGVNTLNYLVSVT